MAQVSVWWLSADMKIVLGQGKVTHSTKKEWPGKSTANTLKKLKVKLSIKPNDHGISVKHFCGKPGEMNNWQLINILTAFGKDLVVLNGPPTPDSLVTLGADDDKIQIEETPTQNDCANAAEGQATSTKEERDNAGVSQATAMHLGKRKKRISLNSAESAEDTLSSSSDTGDEGEEPWEEEVDDDEYGDSGEDDGGFSDGN